MSGLLRKPIVMSLMISLLSLAMAHKYSSRPGVLWIDLGPSSRNCLDIKIQGHNTSGLYTIYPYECCPNRPLQLYCDMETDGGGWNVIQRRDDIQPREDFFRTWMEYALGFGDLKGEFWLGLDHIHALTDQTLHELRFDLGDFDNNTRYAHYKFFYVHDRQNNYKMEVNSYSGDAGDGFSGLSGQPFTAKDKDLDTWGDNCAVKFKGAWWYAACHTSNLNGFHHAGKHESYADGINWHPWQGFHYSLKKTEIKIRPSY